MLCERYLVGNIHPSPLEGKGEKKIINLHLNMFTEKYLLAYRQNTIDSHIKTGCDGSSKGMPRYY